MNGTRLEESPAASQPAARASTWLADLVLLAALAAWGTKQSGTFVHPAPAEPTVAVTPAPAPSPEPPPPPAPLPVPTPPSGTKQSDTFVQPAPAPSPEPSPPSVPTPPSGTKQSGTFVQPVVPPYRGEWRAAAARAAQRDLDGAVAILRRAARESIDARREAVADLEDLDRLRAFEDRAAGRMSKLAKGSRVELEIRGRGVVAGDVLQADRERVEVRTADGPLFVEFVDLAWPTLAGWGDEDARALALAYYLSGRRLDEKHGGLPEPAPPTPPDRLELDARSLLYEAERAFRKPASRSAAVANYRLLLSDFPAASVVRRSLPRITARSKSPEELYFGPADLRGSGNFRRHGAAWRAEGELDFSQVRFTFVEAEFEAEPEVARRAFLRLGGCCEERFLAYAQASGLEKTHPARGVKVAVEPGSIYAQILRHPSAALPKAHVDGHPLLWGWVELPLPPFAGPGPKRIRILAAREGLLVSGLLLSTSRSSAPTDVELTALEAERDVE